jgi:hypothetical protein
MVMAFVLSIDYRLVAIVEDIDKEEASDFILSCNNLSRTNHVSRNGFEE